MQRTFSHWFDKKMRSTPELSEETNAVEKILHDIETIAIVGISRNEHRDSHYVGRYLQLAGYEIIPVNPGADTILGQKAYKDLASIPGQVDAVDIFMRPDHVPVIVEQALSKHPKAIWVQLGGGSHPEEKKKAEKAGVFMVDQRCIKVDHQFLVRDKQNT